jgi:mannose-6-phosphate isomerase-like protein (cupin superfamily)
MVEELYRTVDEIRKIKIDPNVNVDRMLTVSGGRLKDTTKLYWAGPVIRTPEASVSREDFAAGSIVNWFFDYTEVHYILAGKAEITYRLAPLYLEEKSFTAEVGDVYVIPKGAMMQFKVDPSGPYKKMCIIMPGFLIDKYLKDLPRDTVEAAFKKGIYDYE